MFHFKFQRQYLVQWHFQHVHNVLVDKCQLSSMMEATMLISVTKVLGLPYCGASCTNFQPLLNFFMPLYNSRTTRAFVFQKPSLGQLYTFCISHFTDISQMFSQNTAKYKTLTTHFSYFMRISCFINAAKKTTKFFDFSREYRPSCEMRKKWCEIPCYTLFIFRISRLFSRISR